jgi:hypothetical protein
MKNNFSYSSKFSNASLSSIGLPSPDSSPTIPLIFPSSFRCFNFFLLSSEVFILIISFCLGIMAMRIDEISFDLGED